MATGTLTLEEGSTPSLKGNVALAKIDAREMAGACWPCPAPSSLGAAARHAPCSRGTGRQTCAAGDGRQRRLCGADNEARPRGAGGQCGPGHACRQACAHDGSCQAGSRGAGSRQARDFRHGRFALAVPRGDGRRRCRSTITEVLYRKGTMRDLVVTLEIHKGVITVPQFKAVLPGDMVLQANATAPVGARGRAAPSPQRPSRAPRRCRRGPGQPAISALPDRSCATRSPGSASTCRASRPDKLQKLDLKGKLASTANGLQIADLTIDLDGQQATGSGARHLRAAPDGGDDAAARPLRPRRLHAARAACRADRADHRRREGRDRRARHRPAGDARAAGAAAARQDVPVFGLKAKVAKLVFRKETLSGVEGDVIGAGQPAEAQHRQGRRPAGRQDGRQGLGDRLRHRAALRLTFNATMPDADKLIDYAGLPKFINGKIGAASAGGGVAGTMDALTLRNATATLLGATLQATGTLGLGQNFRFDFSSFALQTQDASRLLAVATGRAQAGTGAIDANGAFKGDEQRAIFDGNLTAVGTPMAGHIDATLGKRPNITANLRIPGTLDFDHWLGVAGGPAAVRAAPQAAAAAAPGAGAGTVGLGPPRAATGKPIDLSALRAFDATLNLETSAVADRLAQGHLRRHAGQPAERPAEGRQAHRPVLRRRR